MVNLPQPDSDFPREKITTPEELPDFLSSAVVQVERLSPASLAYIGDAVYELYIRSFYLLPPKQIYRYHQKVVAQVRAESQADALQHLLPHLTNGEKEILRRGRNAATKCPRRLSPKVYQQATSLETLIGYLYLKNPQRLQELFAKLNLESEGET